MGSISAGGEKHSEYRRLYVSIIFVCLAALPLVLLAALFDSSGRLSVILAGILCLLAIGFPLLLPGRKTTLYEPLVPMSVSVLIGSTLRSIYIAYSDSPRVANLMMSQTYGEIASGGIWLALGLLAMALGYTLTRSRLPIENIRWLFEREFNTGGRFNLAVIAALAIVLASTVLFIDVYGISFAWDAISGKRTVSIVTQDGQEVYTTLGYIRMMSEIGTSALYFYVAVKLYQSRRFTLPGIALLLLLFVSSAAIPFLSSSRSEVGVVFVNVVVLFLVFGRLKPQFLLAAVALVLVIISAMAQLRALSQNASYTSETGFVDLVVGSGNFVDIGRTTAIFSRVPGTTDHLYGMTYLSLFTAPIPKVLWPEKPNPSLGPYVRSEIFGVWTRNNGWPPNIIGEAYINFGYFGIFAVCFIFGSMVKLIYNSFAMLIPKNPIATLLYVPLFWPIGIQLIQLNFAQGSIIAAESMVSTILFILMATRRRRRSSSQRTAAYPASA